MNKRLGLALNGGGFTGYLFEIGALTALDDLFEDGFTVNDFDFYVGVSAGSAAAALMANGVKADEILRANLTGERPYYFQRRDIFVPAVGEGIKSLARAIQQLSPVIKLYYQHRREMGLIDLLEKAQETLPGGIYTLDPFARYLEATFAHKGLSNVFATVLHDLYIPAIDLESGDMVMFGDEGWSDVLVSKAVTASSAAPVYFCPVRIGDRDYIDAGIGRLACFELAAKKDVDFMMIIHPSSYAGSAFEPRPVPTSCSVRRHRGFLSIAEQASRINLEARFSLAFDYHRRETPDRFFVVCPDRAERDLFERCFLSFRDRLHLIRCGYLAVVKAMNEQFGRIQPILAQHGVSISMAKLEERTKGWLEHFAAEKQTDVNRESLVVSRYGGGQLSDAPL
ncbi:MAG TPA: patatin-like phospholipase family protein [Nitrospirales bacterium]|nr:patatin-like phospholipase family protein [Nitrospirales bacterium]